MEKQPKERLENPIKLIPELKDLGPIFKTSMTVDLTESETEIFVQCTKHVFEKHLVLQFECTNTLSDQILENLHISLEVS